MDISDNWALGLADILPEPQQSSVDQYRVVDLFAGCGGLALGFRSAGFDTVGFETRNRAAYLG